MVKFGAPKDPAATGFHMAKDFAEFIAPRHELDPTVFFLAKDGKMGMLTLTGDKRAFGPATAQILREHGCQWYVYLVESWVTSRETPLPPGTRISDLPLDDRTEEVMIFLVRKGRGIELVETAKVERYRDQRRLGPWQMEGAEYRAVSGLMPMEW